MNLYRMHIGKQYKMMLDGVDDVDNNITYKRGKRRRSINGASADTGLTALGMAPIASGHASSLYIEHITTTATV